jgi:hypothetical protein
MLKLFQSRFKLFSCFFFYLCLRFVIGTALSGFLIQSGQANPLPLKHFDAAPEKGWYFYESPPKLAPLFPRIKMPKAKENSSPNTKKGPSQSSKSKHPCRHALSWTPECGFINPTTQNLSRTKAFSFEQKEYHNLMRSYALYPNNQKAVYQFQRFNMWVLNQSMTASYTWQYNLQAHPDVNANVQVPVSQFGIALIKNIEATSEKSFWTNLASHAFFVLVTRTNNSYCQAQGRVMKMLERQTGVTVWDFSVDDGHLPEFSHVMNYPSLNPHEKRAVASHLKLGWLPAVYLYLKPAGKKQVGRWIRVSSGITPLNKITERTINFVEAYRHAIIQGVGKKKHSAPNFSANHLYELANDSLQLTSPEAKTSAGAASIPTPTPTPMQSPLTRKERS